MSAWLEIRPGRYYARIWFCGREGADILSALWRDVEMPAGEWHFTSRLRVHMTDAPADHPLAGLDPKHGTELTLRDERGGEGMADIVSRVAIAVACLAEALEATDRSELVLDTDDPEKILDALVAQPWARGTMLGAAGDA